RARPLRPLWLARGRAGTGVPLLESVGSPASGHASTLRERRGLIGGPMRLLPSLSMLLLLGCAAEPVAPGAEDLVGRWRSEPEALSPNGSMDRVFIVLGDRHTVQQVTSRGLLPGQMPDQVSAQVALFGRIAVRGDQFVIHPDSEVTHDVFYGPSNRSVRRDFRGWPLDSVRYAVQGEELRLEFYTYPADAPELTRQVFHRSGN